MAFGDEYSSNYAYFIAGGSTLAAIEKYEADRANPKALQSAIAKEFGAKEFTGFGESAYLVFEKPVQNPALVLEEVYKSGDSVYRPNLDTPEGKALQARFADIPEFDLSQDIFAQRLTGAAFIETNPDHLQQGYDGGLGHYRDKATATAATFTKYGDTYVVSMPRVIRGIFNEVSAKASVDEHFSQAAGYRYEWASPPDSTEIAYSKVVELNEKQKGDQLNKRSIAKKVRAYSRD